MREGGKGEGRREGLSRREEEEVGDTRRGREEWKAGEVRERDRRRRKKGKE